MEVVEMLNDHSPVLKATKFVGQTQGKQEGDKGFNQKEQKKVCLLSDLDFTIDHSLLKWDPAHEILHY